MGKAVRPSSVLTSPTRRNSVRPISEFVFIANVAATVTLLALACTGRAKAFHHVSTLSVFDQPALLDGAAHEGALGSTGSTIAVVATGLDQVYPRRHLALAGHIAAEAARS